jgi:hypothetical protein
MLDLSVQPPSLSDSIAELSPPASILSALLWVQNHLGSVIPIPTDFEPLNRFLKTMAPSTVAVCHETELPVIRQFEFWRLILVPHNEEGLGPRPLPHNAACYPLSYALSSARTLARQHPGKGVLLLDSPLFSQSFVGETSLAFQVFYGDGAAKAGRKKAPDNLEAWYDPKECIRGQTGQIQVRQWALA